MFAVFNILPLSDESSFPLNPEPEPVILLANSNSSQLQAQEVCRTIRCGEQDKLIPFVKRITTFLVPGKKIHYQVYNWPKTNKNITKPENSSKVLVVVDLLNVSIDEKHAMQARIQQTAQQTAVNKQSPAQINIIYIN